MTGHLPDTLGVSAGRALLPVNVSDPAALLGLALRQFVSLSVTTEKCPAGVTTHSSVVDSVFGYGLVTHGTLSLQWD